MCYGHVPNLSLNGGLKICVQPYLVPLVFDVMVMTIHCKDCREITASVITLSVLRTYDIRQSEVHDYYRIFPENKGPIIVVLSEITLSEGSMSSELKLWPGSSWQRNSTVDRDGVQVFTCSPQLSCASFHLCMCVLLLGVLSEMYAYSI